MDLVQLKQGDDRIYLPVVAGWKAHLEIGLLT